MRWAIFGTGEVARKFALGLPRGHTVRFVSSRTAESAARFARALGIADHAPGYPVPRDVDCVYIATPPSEHEAQAIACIAAGLPVLVEKPFAASAAAAERIAAAARARGVFAMEAMWTRFLPVVARAAKAVRGGAVGEVRQIVGGLGFSHRVPADLAKFDPARGGGAIAYYGVYPLSLGALFAGRWADASAIVTSGANGVDEDVVATVRYAGGAIGSFTASLRTTLSNDLAIHGTHGTLRLAAPLFRPSYATLRRFDPRAGGGGGGRLGAVREGGLAQAASRAARLLSDAVPRGLVRARQAGNGYGYEALEVARMLAGGRTESAIMPLDDTLDVMRLADRLRQGF